MKKNIVIVTEYFYPNESTTSYYITNIVQSFINSNNVHVVCNTDIKDNVELDMNNLSVERIQENSLNKKNLISRFFKYIIASFKLTLSVYRHIKQNTNVFAVTNPVFLILTLALLKKIKNFHYTLLVYDVFPENLVAAGIIKQSSFFYKVIKKIFDWSYSKVDVLVVIGRDMEEVILKKTNATVKIVLIENWCDYERIIPSNKLKNKLLSDLNLVNKKIFLFAGNLGRVQGIENILNASMLVKSEDFILLFIGDGVMKQYIQEYITHNKCKNIIYAGSFPQNEENIFLNACDVSLISLSESMYGIGVPSKSYYNMAAEKPILYIGDEKSEIARVVSENNIGWVCEPNNDISLANKIDEICLCEEIYLPFGKKAREVVRERYSKEIILAKYEQLYE
jgi:glycosyltransferase involved in cell wall biosynthesis